MKKMHFVLFFVVGFAFLFFSCDVTEKPNSTIPELVEIAKSNDQGEDNDDQGENEGNGKKPPVANPPVEDEDNPPAEEFTEADNLLEKSNLTMGAGIWNDYMPGGWKLTPEGERASIFTIHFDSPVEIPQMEVFATVITERITIPVLLYDIYNGSGTYGTLFRKDFRPVDGIRLNDGEEYTIEIIVKILGEQQTITTEKKKVGVTW